MIRYFDGHNDLLLRLTMANVSSSDFLDGDGKGHVDLPRAQKGGMVGGFYAMFSPPDRPAGQPVAASFNGLPPMLPADRAWYWVKRELALFERIIEDGAGKVAHCRDGAAVSEAIENGIYAMILHLEGCEAIEADLDLLHVLYAAGLRSLGPVWSRETIFGTGVPLKFPGSPDIGPGLTDAGKALIREANKLRIVVDLSHMNEKGFWDIAEISDAPLVATHSNVHALCTAPRNLTDKQLDAIRESGGMVGLNFGARFLREDGQANADVPIGRMIEHLDYMLERLGEDHVGLGSDFDGVEVPKSIRDVSDMPTFFEALAEHGHGPELIEKIAWRNWVSLLERTLDR
ncbi:MAG: membrane dipeptidase [Hyphomicrobiaceae bacterium]|nr:membrane dipeptidase [Hyphomicrobiaceae bacterium]